MYKYCIVFTGFFLQNYSMNLEISYLNLALAMELLGGKICFEEIWRIFHFEECHLSGHGLKTHDN